MADLKIEFRGVQPVPSVLSMNSGDVFVLDDGRQIAVSLAPEAEPSAEVDIAGKRISAVWERWVPDDLPKTLRIDTRVPDPLHALDVFPLIDLAWHEADNLLRVWIDVSVGSAVE